MLGNHKQVVSVRVETQCRVDKELSVGNCQGVDDMKTVLRCRFRGQCVDYYKLVLSAHSVEQVVGGAVYKVITRAIAQAQRSPLVERGLIFTQPHTKRVGTSINAAYHDGEAACES